VISSSSSTRGWRATANAGRSQRSSASAGEVRVGGLAGLEKNVREVPRSPPVVPQGGANSRWCSAVAKTASPEVVPSCDERERNPHRRAAQKNGGCVSPPGASGLPPLGLLSHPHRSPGACRTPDPRRARVWCVAGPPVLLVEGVVRRARTRVLPPVRQRQGRTATSGSRARDRTRPGELLDDPSVREGRLARGVSRGYRRVRAPPETPRRCAVGTRVREGTAPALWRMLFAIVMSRGRRVLWRDLSRTSTSRRSGLATVSGIVSRRDVPALSRCVCSDGNSCRSLRYAGAVRRRRTQSISGWPRTSDSGTLSAAPKP